MSDLQSGFYIYSKKLTTAAASSDMTIDGASSPTQFYFSPGTTALICELSVLLEDTGSASLSSFGSLSELSQGILIEVLFGAQILEIMTIKSNADLCQFFDIYCGNGSNDTLGSPSGFGGSVDWVRGVYRFEPRKIYLSGSDRLRVTIRDDLSGIGFLEMSLKLLREV